MTSEENIKGKVTRDDGVPTVPRPGDYYANRKDKDLEAGDLALVTYVDGDRIKFVSGEQEYGWDVASFLENYEFDPHGAEKREAEILSLMREVREMQRTVVEIQEEEEAGGQLEIGAATQPLLADGAGATEPRGGETGGGEGVVGGEQQPGGSALIPRREQAAIVIEQSKLRAAATRNRIELFLESVAKKKDRLKALRKEQEAALEAMSKLRKIVKRAEQIIKILNVYLGQDEEIVMLRDGEAAPPETKISVRQLVLFADEECAINAKHGGLDFENVHLFDEWVSKPENLQQVLPDLRGIVAFKPRRSNKEYGSVGANVYLNALNKQTYFLIRNGERLYRIASGVSVGDNLFPTATEFDELFIKKEYDWETREYKYSRMRPGSHDFAKALDEADEKQKKYGMVLLMIQGLIDRTDVFHPFLADYVNVMDRRRHEDFISYVQDGENLLTTGRPLFSEWMQELNAKLDVGHRIIGVFNMYERGLRHDNYGKCSRLHPPRAEFPDNLTLYTIERREGEYFTFYYQRGERKWEEYEEPVPDKPGYVYVRHREADFEKRASCRVKPSDRFILNFDAVNVEDIEFYLSDRVNRHEYLVMFPLLQTVVKLKKQERRQEEPFRKLLVGQIMREHDATLEDASAHIDGLISWWKFKNREHRALLSADTKALRMIVKEYGLRREREAERAEQLAVARKVVEAVRAAHSEVIYVGHKRENIYVALVPENDENIFVKEQEWRLDTATGSVAMKEEKRWRGVDSRRLRWAAVWTGGRWGDWMLDARTNRYLTDPEREAVAPDVWETVRKREESWKSRQSDKASIVFWPLALSVTPEQEIQAWYADRRAVVSKTDASKVQEPSLERATFTWKRDPQGKLKLTLDSTGHYQYKISEMRSDDRIPKEGERPWEERKRKKAEKKGAGVEARYKLLWTDPAAIERFDKECERALAAIKRKDKLFEYVWRSGVQVEEAMRERLIAAARERYDRDHGAPELWEKHLERLNIPDCHSSSFREAVGEVVYRGGAVNGRTVREIVEEAAAKGCEIEAEELAKLPLDLVINVDAGRGRKKGRKGK
jgi:hypothetical protein